METPTSVEAEAPPAVQNWPEPPSCGRYENRNEPASAEQRRKNRCLLEALAAGREAELVVTYTTIEGDPITEYHSVLGPERVETFVDSTQDSYGGRRGWSHYSCAGLEENDAGFLDGVDCQEQPRGDVPAAFGEARSLKGRGGPWCHDRLSLGPRRRLRRPASA